MDTYQPYHGFNKKILSSLLCGHIRKPNPSLYFLYCPVNCSLQQEVLRKCEVDLSVDYIWTCSVSDVTGAVGGRCERGGGTVNVVVSTHQVHLISNFLAAASSVSSAPRHYLPATDIGPLTIRADVIVAPLE